MLLATSKRDLKTSMRACDIRRLIDHACEYFKPEDAKELAFLNAQIAALRCRMGIPVEGLITNLREAKDRVTDLTRAAEHILSVNNYFEAQWERQFADVESDPLGPRVFNRLNTSRSIKLEAPEPLLPQYGFPMGMSSKRTRFFNDAKFGTESQGDLRTGTSSPVPRSFSIDDPTSSYTRLSDEPRVGDWTSFLPTVSRVSGRETRIPKRFRQ